MKKMKYFPIFSSRKTVNISESLFDLISLRLVSFHFYLNLILLMIYITNFLILIITK